MGKSENKWILGSIPTQRVSGKDVRKNPQKWAIPVKFRNQIFLLYVNAAFKAATVHNPYKFIVVYECMSCVWMIWLFIQENIITLVINLGWTHQYWRPVETRIIIIIRQRQISNIDSQPFTGRHDWELHT